MQLKTSPNKRQRPSKGSWLLREGLLKKSRDVKSCVDDARKKRGKGWPRPHPHAEPGGPGVAEDEAGQPQGAQAIQARAIPGVLSQVVGHPISAEDLAHVGLEGLNDYFMIPNLFLLEKVAHLLHTPGVDLFELPDASAFHRLFLLFLLRLSLLNPGLILFFVSVSFSGVVHGV